jgi:bifunctional non-homologous end joining protein LigD
MDDGYVLNKEIVPATGSSKPSGGSLGRGPRAGARGYSERVGLEEYQRKRDFTTTPEPSGTRRPKTRGKSLWDRLPKGRRFCVQKHRATRLHYDFRLEHGGVLLSWAIPKGPSLDPAAKRFATQTEDHPVDYGDFEGVIPSGYGMGTVELWDAGTFQWVRESAEDPERQLEKGDIKFQLEGEKLKGEFALVRLGERGRGAGGGRDGDRSFLLIKKKDQSAVQGYDAAADDGSVRSGRTLDEIAAEAGGDPREERRRARSAATSRRARDGASAPAGSAGHSDPAAGAAPEPPAELPRNLPSPMLAVAVDRPFSRPGWLFELKYDGIRAIVGVAGERVRVVGRRGREETARYPEAAGIPAQLRARSAVLDCEIVVLDGDGRTDFEKLQSRLNAEGLVEVRRRAERHPVTFAAFDLLSLDGRDLTGTPLRIRKKTLREAILPSGPLLYADHLEAEGEAFFAALQQRGLEGMLAKRADSLYQAGRRSSDWLKVKAWQTQAAAIAGWTEGHGRRGHLGALVLAVREGTGWVHAGEVGTGFSEKVIADLLRRLEPLRRSAPVFPVPPRIAGRLHWVEPSLACEVRHAGWTTAGVLRHPAFVGLRPDLAAEQCTREQAAPVEEVIGEGDGRPRGRAAAARPEAPADPPARRAASSPKVAGRRRQPAAPPSLDPAIAEALDVLSGLRADDWWEVAGRRLRLTHLDKPLWPDPVITKRRMVDYYVRVSPFLLPHLRDRPLSTQVFPNGITGHSFWRKDKPEHAPAWIDAWRFRGSEGEKNWIVVREPATLGWLANAAVIDLHPWHSRVDAPHQPDWAVFDLDPFEPASFDDVRDIARMVKAALDHLGLRGLLKTSGQTGLQIYVPLRRGPDYDRVRGWVEEVARAIGRVEPGRISWEWTVSRRAGKIRIDYTQNIINKTLAAPYSLRPHPTAPVSTPLAWEELDDRRLRPDLWTIDTIWDRLAAVGDLFSGVLEGDQRLPG